MLDHVMGFLGLGTVVFGFMISVAYFCAWVLSHSLGVWKARMFGTAFAGAIFLPILVPGTLVYGVVGAVGLLILIVIMKSDVEDA